MGMKIGLLWFGGDPRRSLTGKVTEAAERYYEKFGQRPSACFVNVNSLLSPKAASLVRALKSPARMLHPLTDCAGEGII